MVVAFLDKGKNSKVAYRCFTDRLYDKLDELYSELGNTKAEIRVYKSLYGDMDENMLLPQTEICTDLSTFKKEMKKP